MDTNFSILVEVGKLHGLRQVLHHYIVEVLNLFISMVGSAALVGS